MAQKAKLRQYETEQAGSILHQISYYGGATTVEYPDAIKPEFDFELPRVFQTEPGQVQPDLADHSETEPSISDNLNEPEFIPEFTSERNLYKAPISYKKLATSGLGKIIKATKNAGSAIADKYYVANTVAAGTFNAIQSVGEKLSKLEGKTNRSKVIKSVGGLALVGVAAYAAYRGFSLLETNHSHQAAHQTAQHLLPAKVPQHHEAAQAIPVQPKAVQTPAHNLPNHHPKALTNPISNKLANYNLKDWTWNLAHRVRPGHENSVITKALRSYQQITGNHAQLVQHGHTSVIEVNNHIVNSSQMEAINRLVVGG